ncbi:hypothetical protein [uncultured Fibrobacter sp.]|nr:hypothetical protein [uncultured Fibrobacter sp.]
MKAISFRKTFLISLNRLVQCLCFHSVECCQIAVEQDLLAADDLDQLADT